MDKEIILLVHGTFASSDSDSVEQATSSGESPQWWQVGSEFYEKVNEKVSPSIRCHEVGEVFHWSGDNSEIERRKSGKKLLERCKELEEKKQPYHIIGHSHGGSITWHALCEATKGKKLDFLKSWTTLGTPFQRYRANIANLWFIVPFIFALFSLAWICRTYLWLFIPKKILGYSLPFSVLRVDNLINANSSLIMGCLLIALLFVLLYSGICFLSAFIGWCRVKRFSSMEENAKKLYADKWLCVYSQEDEAINGLTSTLKEINRLLPYWERKKSILGFLLLPIQLPYNLFIFSINNFVWTKLKKRAQGNDYRGIVLDRVSPPRINKKGYSIVSPDVDKEIIEFANKSSYWMVDELRNALGQLASGIQFSALATLFSQKMKGPELVHSSYYQKDHEKIIDIISTHVKNPLVEFPIVEEETPKETLGGQLKARLAFGLVLCIIIFALTLTSHLFSQSSLKTGILSGANLENANLAELDIRGVNMRRANLEGANLSNINLEGANLKWASLESCNFENANLKNVSFARANIVASNFRNADLSGASFVEANLENTIFEGAKFKNADLVGVNLRGSYLEKTIISIEQLLNASDIKNIWGIDVALLNELKAQSQDPDKLDWWNGSSREISYRDWLRGLSVMSTYNIYLWEMYTNNYDGKEDPIIEQKLPDLEKSEEKNELDTAAVIYAIKAYASKDKYKKQIFTDKAKDLATRAFPKTVERVNLLLQGEKPTEVEKKINRENR